MTFSTEMHRKTTSGTDVFVYPNPALHSFYLSLFVRTGGLYEDEENQGISHFLEHIAIRNVNAIMNGKMYETLDRYGLDFNASTYREMIQFYISGATATFPLAAEILCKLFSEIQLSAKDVDAERKRIKAEIREGDEKNTLSNFTTAVLYPDGCGRFPIVGNVSSVNRITRARLEAYRKETFCAENIFFYLTGNVTEDDVKTLCDTVATYPLTHGFCRDNQFPIPADFGKRGGQVRVKNADYTVVRFNFDIDMTKVTPAECDLLYDALFTGYNAKFFIEMSERRGLFYDINGTVDRYRNIGVFSFSFEVKPADLQEAVACSVRLLKEVKDTPLSPDAIPRAVYVDNADMLYDDASDLNFTMAYDAHVLGCPYSSLSDRKAAYAGVCGERLREVARCIFTTDNLMLTMKGSSKTDTESLHRLLLSLDK